jgi:hypothetical protein
VDDPGVRDVEVVSLGQLESRPVRASISVRLPAEISCNIDDLCPAVSGTSLS